MCSADQILDLGSHDRARLVEIHDNWATPPKQSRCQVISRTCPAVGGFELGKTPLVDVIDSRVELGARDLEGGELGRRLRRDG